MAGGVRASEIHRRRARKAKRRKQKVKDIRQAIQRGRTHPDRVRLAQEFLQKTKAAKG